MDTVAARDSHGRRMQPKLGRMNEHKPAIEEVHILWITGGLGCDGDSVSITAATQPSLEDVMLGAIPGLPKVHLHNPVLAYTVGDEFMAPFHKAARGELGRVSSQRENQRGRLLGGLWHRSSRNGWTAWRRRRSRCRNLRCLRRHPRDGG